MTSTVLGSDNLCWIGFNHNILLSGPLELGRDLCGVRCVMSKRFVTTTALVSLVAAGVFSCGTDNNFLPPHPLDISLILTDLDQMGAVTPGTTLQVELTPSDATPRLSTLIDVTSIHADLLPTVQFSDVPAGPATVRCLTLVAGTLRSDLSGPVQPLNLEPGIRQAEVDCFVEVQTPPAPSPGPVPPSSPQPLQAGYGSTPEPDSSLDLGSALLGEIAETERIRVQETGNIPLEVSAPVLSGENPNDFMVDPGDPFQIPDGGPVQVIDVTCTPTSLGVRTASLSYTTNDPDNDTVHYELVCEGTQVELDPDPGLENTPPVADDDRYSSPFETPLQVDASSGVLNNDSDADGDDLTAQLESSPENGSLALEVDGSFVYTPDLDFSGVDSFTYTANDGEDSSNLATVSINIEMPPSELPTVPLDIVGDEPDVVFVIDVSGSTNSPFQGDLDEDNDVNGDGSPPDPEDPPTILDAELAAFIRLNQALVDLSSSLGEEIDVAVVVFSGDGSGVDMSPESGIQSFTQADADRDGNQILDVEEVLRSVRFGGGSFFGNPVGINPSGTDFELALDATIVIVQEFVSDPANGNVIFLSDGGGGGNFLDEVVELTGDPSDPSSTALVSNLRAFGVGADANLDQLTDIDPNTGRFMNVDDLLQFLGR